MKNWTKFQHYKNRRPPWIKLYNSLLDDYAFTRLSDASKAHLICIWLLAARLDNKIPNDADWIAKQIGAWEFVDIQALIGAGFIELDGEMLAIREQPAMSETETEVETKTETETEKTDKSPAPPKASGGSGKKAGSLIPAETWKAAGEYKLTSLVGKRLQQGYEPLLICAAVCATDVADAKSRAAYFQSFFTENGKARMRVPAEWAMNKAKAMLRAEARRASKAAVSTIGDILREG